MQISVMHEYKNRYFKIDHGEFGPQPHAEGQKMGRERDFFQGSRFNTETILKRFQCFDTKKVLKHNAIAWGRQRLKFRRILHGLELLLTDNNVSTKQFVETIWGLPHGTQHHIFYDETCHLLGERACANLRKSS